MRPGLGPLWAAAVGLLLLAPSHTEEAAAPTQADQDPGITALRTLSCGLQRHRPDQPQTCSALGDAMPERLRELMASPKISDEFKQAALSQDFLRSVSPAQMANLPVPFLLHISSQFLRTSSPQALSAIVRKHPDDVVVARKVLSALDLVDDNARTEFIRELGLSSGLSSAVQAAVGEAAVRWWPKDMKEHSDDLARVGTPLLAALPPGYLAELGSEDAANMMLALRNHPWDTPNDPKWALQPPATKRVWMHMFKKDPNSGKAQLVTKASDGLAMLWAGATPEEIGDLQYDDDDKASLTQLKQLTKLQVRGFLTTLYRQSALSSTELNEVFDWMLLLSPAGLQRFLVNDTDFSSLPSADTSCASYPTLKQVFEEVVASSMAQGRIQDPTDAGSWGRNIKDLGRLAYLIRATHLANYSQHRLPEDVLAAMDTYKLSAFQARYLTSKGKFVDLRMPLKELEKLHGLTRAIPTGKLVDLRTSTVSNDVVLHLVESLPFTNPARSAVIFSKLRASYREARVLEAVLRNPTPAQYLSLISARELSDDRAVLEQSFAEIKSPPSRMRAFSLGDLVNAHLNKKDNIDDHLKLVPRHVLSAILGSARRELLQSATLAWNTDTLLSPSRQLVRGALTGLTCADVFAMDLVDFPVIMAEFNERRKAAGLPFPKSLQHCLQRAMEDYLDMKKTIRQYGPEVSLIEVLEPSDIEAFGGYLLSTLKPLHVMQSPHSEQILATIGSLSPQELLAAVHDIAPLRKFALSMVDIYQARRSLGPRCLFALGSLHMFLPADVVSAVQPEAWKLLVEANAGKPRSLAVCADSEQRDAWHRLVVRAFGSAASWSPGVLAAMGDTLAALPTDVLSTIRTVTWRDAADTLAQRTIYHLETDAPGSDHSLSFVDVCRSLMPPEEQSLYYWSVRRVVRHYLRAGQLMLDTVEHASQLLRRLQSRSSRTHVAADYRPHHRQADPEPERTSPADTSPATVTELTTTTTTTEATSTTALDEEFDWDATPDWMAAFSTSTGPPVHVPKTVMVRGDGSSAPPTEDDSTTASITTESISGDKGSAATEESLMVWDEAGKKLPILNSKTTATPLTTWMTPSVLLDKTLPSALRLPSLTEEQIATYPNQSGASAELELSETTTKYSADTTAAMGVAGDVDTNTVSRRRRGADQAEVESELQVGRDVEFQVTCDAIRALGEASSLALVRGDPDRMLDVEVEDCIELLGALKLKSHMARSFWTKIPSARRGDLVGDLGRLVSAMTLDEVREMNYSLSHDRALDTISVIAQNVMDMDVLDAVAAQVIAQNPDVTALAGGGGGVDPDTLLVALGPMVCSLPLNLQRLLLARRGGLLHAARSLHGVRFHCNTTCLEELVRGALQDGALGPLSSWTAEDVHNMGPIIAGMHPDQIEQLKRPKTEVEQPLSGITASAIACMTPPQVVAIGDHLSVLSPEAAAAVTPHQAMELTYGQQAELIRVRNMAFTRIMGRQDLGHDGEQSSSTSRTLPRPAALLAALWALLLVFV